MFIHAAATLLFLSLLAEANQSAEHHRQSERRHTVGRRGLFGGLLGGSPSSVHPNSGVARPLGGSIPVAVRRSGAGGDIPVQSPAGLIGGDSRKSGTGGVFDGVSGLMPLTDILNGVPKYNPAISTAGPRPTSTQGDAPWTQSESAYREMITCHAGLRGQRGVVLLVPPTGGDGQQTWTRSPYFLYLPKQGFSICWVDNPTKGTGDIQLTAEYVAYAIKYLSAQSGQPISIVSFSQGGLNTQWALTFWPSAAKVVKNFVALAAPFRGTSLASVVCPLLEVIGGCLPALFQMIGTSRAIRALTAAVPGSGARAMVPTTSVYTRDDDLVLPQTGSHPISALDGASNIAIQDICGIAHVADHFLLVGDLATYSIALNALMSGRPANPATVDKTHCNQLDSAGAQAANLGNDLKITFSLLIGNTNDRVSMALKTLTTLTVPKEPSLQMYVCRRGFATGCTGNGFSGSQDRDSLLNSLPTTANGLGSLAGGLLL
ncbi:hypothetical protein KEM48_001378 [Puccinia striiformis f. sp. tritici PST-130]|nr:hypothetical protein Pst134EB_030746 [Puccinia striiformis f. sp. tritici]KAI9603398.1 hypothetical protein KEM48_001378 [Puccinia striiformis f. sp. tritici PST-130]